ncbi:RCC1 and BTB domain-containing protein 1 [Aplysia californica]|uniref:RCC1 and BTB domain-containing protein 1 n=1 Tax=Aplysia californica TaxID=6500 RepID=A0ABM0JXI3_APLCA|nr:RCC1 and BTB domain-containing protein 1 [Aplysia californica]XP_005103870.2 RCC1 and BTB domain-containing protein 1 [Aplysia californica]
MSFSYPVEFVEELLDFEDYYSCWSFSESSDSMAESGDCWAQSAEPEVGTKAPTLSFSPRIPDLFPSRHLTDLSRWPLFSVLDLDLISTIKKICVFGSAGNEAVFITENDDVFAFGSNCSSCLGLGDTHSSFEPRKIDILCRKKVVDIAFGSGPHVVAVTRAGEVFSWGLNGYCQLGNGGSNQGFVPAAVTTNLANRQVVKVACGSHHSMVLTVDGEVYAWGQNNCGQVGTGSTANQPSPRKVTSVIGALCAVSIACGQTSSVALLDNGEVYGWGYNGNGQLGVGNNVNQPNPCRVHMLQAAVITQITCGYAHTLALSDEGTLFSWGANSYGQLGTGNKANMVSPAKVLSLGEKYVEVAASHYSHISAAMTQKGKVVMWGQCRGQSLTQPRITRFSSTDDVFAAFSTPPVSWRIYSVDLVKGTRIADTIAKAFDNPENSDLKFVVEGKEIHVHKAILKLRCEHFRSMFQSCWDEDSKESIEISQYGYSVYHAFLRYLYTDEVDLQPDEAIGLLDLSNAYCESQLKLKCEAIIRQGIGVDNVAMLYAAAIKFGAQQLEEFCFRFCLAHMTAVTQTEAFIDLDEAVVKDFIRKAGQSGAFRT